MKNAMNEISKKSYTQLSKLGSTLNLSFSSQVLLGSKIVALDGVKKKVLITDMNDVSGQPWIIELDEVEAISVKKNYSSIKPGELTKKPFEEFLETILLQFEYRDRGRNIGLTFYERRKNNFRDLALWERIARNWQLILSKMIRPKKEEIPLMD
ncbi:MAG: hypothetical protein ABI151_03675 [Chitinophagaceae bacterium]